MASRPRIVQVVFILAAAALMSVAALLQGSIRDQSSKYGMIPPAVEESHPNRALLTVMPGGLRVFAVNYLWIRAQKLQDEGKYHEALQLADLICLMQPNSDAVWSYQAWNMAWNISVTMRTPAERWLWINNAVKLLRDKAIPRNPRTLSHYKELGWIFFSKMGGFMDDMHKSYKARWAGEMQRLLGAPPVGEWKVVADEFRPIAEEPLLNKDPRRQGREKVQSDRRDELLKDTKVAAYAALLAKHGVRIDEGLLNAYNRFSTDYAAAVVRPGFAYPQIETKADKALFDAVNDPDHAPARRRMLAFVRAQLLWNVYKMDPEWMLKLMEKYEVPIDWRLVWPHGLYWSSYGVHVCQSKSAGDITSLNTGRIVLNSLKFLTWYGRLTVISDPRNPDSPQINWFFDRRYIAPTHREHLSCAHALVEREKADAEKEDRPPKWSDISENPFRDGHSNYLINAMQVLVASDRNRQANKYFDFLKKTYKHSGDEWDTDSVEQFVYARMRKEGSPIDRVANPQINIAMETAFMALARGDTARFTRRIGYARKVYDLFSATAFERYELKPFDVIAAPILARLLIEPRAAGYNISLLARSRLYNTLDAMGMMQVRVMIYDPIARSLFVQCRLSRPRLDFNKAFPKPPGIEEYRRRLRKKTGE